MIAAIFFTLGFALCYFIKVVPLKRNISKLSSKVDNMNDSIKGMKHHIRSFYKDLNG